MFKKDKHFTTTEESSKGNVLYQIEKLTKKYPKTIQLDEITNIYPKDK